MALQALLVAALLPAASAYAPSGRTTLESSVPPHNASTSSWSVLAKPDPAMLIPLTVVLTLDKTRRALLERTLFEVSDPKHAEYGKHRSHAQIAEILAVPVEQRARVSSFWKRAGAVAVEIAPAKDMMKVVISVADAEKALATTLRVFSHRERKEVTIVRASTRYSLPAALADDIAMVGELLQFPRLRRDIQVEVGSPATWPNACKAAGCDNKVTPAVLAERYKVTSSAPTNGNSMAVAEFQGQYWKQTDLDDFSDSCGVTVTVDTQVGTNHPIAGVESELDIEYIKGVAPEVPLTVVYDSSYSLLSWANQITSLDDPPLVHSVSYGNDEAQQTSTAYMESCNTAFMKAGTAGLSILFASGDQGVCGREGCGAFKTKFHPDFPGASPYITAVGGTDFAEKGVIGDEQAWSDGGGGFSDTFDVPDWQADAVAAYLASPDADLPPQKYYSASGRGYPDVAALGGEVNPYCIANNGRFAGVAGTSASCPVVAAIFAKLNGIRLAASKPPLGYLNPFIYQNGPLFQDVTLGKITGSAKGVGFKAITGWDPATGWGTPDFDALSKVV